MKNLMQLPTRQIRRLPTVAAFVLTLTACGSPPKPPTIDESNRHPANTAAAIELQVCRNDLQNTRLLATESGRLADHTAATLAHMAARQQLLAAMRDSAPSASSTGRDVASPAAPVMSANRIRTVHFEFGSSRLAIPQDAARVLVADARDAPLVVLRGRTDGEQDTPAEARIARDRAVAVRDWLVSAGIAPNRIRVTWQGAGDSVADNGTANGRSLNRRVEIEIYRALPDSSNVLHVAVAPGQQQ